MDRFEAGWEHDAELDAARGGGLQPDSGRDAPAESAAECWPDSVWSHADAAMGEGRELFVDRFSEAELRREMRLSELWGRCQVGLCTVREFFELSTLITEVEGIRGSLCVDCAMLERPNAAANWALADTTLCRGHLRFRLGHARIDGGDGPLPR
jgi:hypothetical protein